MDKKFTVCENRDYEEKSLHFPQSKFSVDLFWSGCPTHCQVSRGPQLAIAVCSVFIQQDLHVVVVVSSGRLTLLTKSCEVSDPGGDRCCALPLTL